MGVSRLRRPHSLGSSGFPSGRIGFYTTIAGTAFSYFSSFEQAPVHLDGHWINDSHYSASIPAGSSLILPSGEITQYRTILLENLRLQKFQATFALTRNSGYSARWMGLIFNAADRGNYDYVTLSHSGTVSNPVGYAVTPTTAPTVATAAPTRPTSPPAPLPTPSGAACRTTGPR